jgi:hypothetical protein
MVNRISSAIRQEFKFTYYLTIAIYTIDKLVDREYLILQVTSMNIHILRSNAEKTKNRLLGKIKNTKQNFNYLKDLESWGTVEIVNSSDTYIEYALI